MQSSEKKMSFFLFKFLKKEKGIMISSSIENIKSARIVEIFNSDGTVTTCPSIHNAAKLLGKKNNNNVYIEVARGRGRFVDIRIPVEVMNRNGTRGTYRSINEVAETLRISTMVTNGRASLGLIPIREVLTKPIMRRKGLHAKCVVEILNENGTTDRTFNSVYDAARVLTGIGSNSLYIYRMVALGKARLVYRAEEEDEEEEVFYDALDQQDWVKEKDVMRPPKGFFKIISLMVKEFING